MRIAEAPTAEALAAERAYLAAARADLARMRARTLALDAHGGNAVSEEYLKGALTRRVIALTDDPDVATVKGDARMAEVLRRAVYAAVRAPTEPLVIRRGSRVWRVPTPELARIVSGLRDRDVRYGAARAMLGQRLAHAVLTRMEAAGESPDDRVQDAIARCPPVRVAVDRLWPKVDPMRLVLALLGDPGRLAEAAEGLLTEAEQSLVIWGKPARGPASAKWSLADATLVDEAADLVQREPSLGHVVLDEAQDLSPMQLRAVGRRCSTAAATVLGDIAQGTTPWATADWTATLRHLGKPDARVEVLSRGYRVPAQIIDFAARLLPFIAPGVAAPEPVRDNPGRLDIVATSDLAAATAAAIQVALRRDGSVGVIVAGSAVAQMAKSLTEQMIEHAVLDVDEDGPRVTVVPASVAKGLEFDHVIVVEPRQIVAAEPRGLRRLYVVLTRAVSGLTVVHAQPLPPELAPTAAA